MKKEFGRTQVSQSIEQMGLMDANEVLAALKHIPSGVVDGLAQQLKAAQDLAKTDENAKLFARVELKNHCVYEARILAAETKEVRNPRTGEMFIKEFPARISIKIYASPNLEQQLSDCLEL